MFNVGRSMFNNPSSLETENLNLEPHTSCSFWDSLMIQKRVIGALLMREILTRYGRHNIGFLWLFVEPMLFTLGVTILWNMKGHGSYGSISITAFVLTGYSMVLLWRNMPNRCVSAIWPNATLFFHRQVKPIDIYLSRIALEALGATASFIILSIVFISLGLVDPPHDLLIVFEGWMLLVWYAASVSFLVGALSEKTEIVDRVWHIFQYLMIPLSGSFFIVDSLPEKAREFVLYIPTVNCVEIIREGYFGTGTKWHYDYPYLLAANTTLLLLGLAQVRALKINHSA
jgi:capsular polysaccharide transport system permease protein